MIILHCTSRLTIRIHDGIFHENAVECVELELSVFDYIAAGTFVASTAYFVFKRFSLSQYVNDNELVLPVGRNSMIPYYGSHFNFSKNPLQFLIDNCIEYNGKDYKYFKNGVPFLCVQSPPLLKQVFRDIGTKLDRYPDKSKLELRGKQSLEFLCGKQHLAQKRVVNHVMGYSCFKKNMQTMYNLCQDYCKSIANNECNYNNWQLNASRLRGSLRQLSMEMITCIIFGEQFTKNENLYLSSLFKQQFDGYKAKFKFNLPYTKYYQSLTAKSNIVQFLKNKVEQRRNQFKTTISNKRQY